MKRLLFFLGAVLVAELLAFAWQAGNPEWEAYQRAFFAAGEARTRSGATADWYGGQPLGIREIRLDALGRVDRCTTCHLGVDDPNFAGAPQPFRAHASLLSDHPPAEFGCTICHNGRGRAVTTLAAHGDSMEAPSRLWRGIYLQAACYLCHGASTLPSEMVGAVLEGSKAINQWRCLRCHRILGEGQSEGPDLSATGSRRDWIELYAHLLNPQAMSPGSTMPDLPLTRAQAEAITAYLLTLQGPGREVFDRRYLPRAVTGELPPVAARMAPGAWSPGGTLPERATFRYDGRALFMVAGCTYCHRLGAKGGEVGPALTYIGRVRELDWLRRWLRDPAELLPTGTMPQLYLNQGQVEALAEYLTTLR